MQFVAVGFYTLTHTKQKCKNIYLSYEEKQHF